MVNGLDFEAVHAAIFARLAAVSGIVTSSRIFRDVDQVSANEQPALFLVSYDDETADTRPPLPPIWHLPLLAFVYLRTDGDGAIPNAVLNAMKTSITNALLWQAGEAPIAIGYWTTLGGKVSHCAVTRIEKNEGLKTGQGVLVFHLEAMSPGGA